MHLACPRSASIRLLIHQRLPFPATCWRGILTIGERRAQSFCKSTEAANGSLSMCAGTAGKINMDVRPVAQTQFEFQLEFKLLSLTKKKTCR